MSRPAIRRIGFLAIGFPAPDWSILRVTGGITFTFLLWGSLAWISDLFFLASFNTEAMDVVLKRLHRRIMLDGNSGLRPLSAHILASSVVFCFFWGALYFSPGNKPLVVRLKPALWIASAITAFWIGWCFIRVAVFYYMRLDIEFDLAIYTFLELRSLIASEIIITLSEIPISIPLSFSALLLLLIMSVYSIMNAAREISGTSVDESTPDDPNSLRKLRPLLISLATLTSTAAVLISLPAERFAARLSEPEDSTSLQELKGPNPFPEIEEIVPELNAQQKFFRKRFGFQLPENTNIVFIILESARESFVDLDNSKFFGESPETLRVKNFFVPVPHSSNSHYSLYTGLHSERDFEEKYERMQAASSLPRLLEKKGYRNYYIYTDHTAFESENLMLAKLGMQVTEKRHLQNRKNPETNDLYATFQFGMDDIALLHAATQILDEEELRQKPFTLSLVMTNSHYPYLNPHPERFNRHNNRTILGRHRNGVDYGVHIADRVVEEFRKRGLDRKTLFVLMSDHGESFGERGFFRHSFSLYNEEVRVPLVFRHPSFSRLARPGDRDLPQGSMLDVFPTIFDMLGLNITAPLHGRTIFNSAYEFRLPLWVWRLDDYRGLLYGEHKYIYNSVDDELYRLDLKDRLRETWKNPSGHALAFVEALMAMDYGKAGGVAASMGDRRGPIIDPESPTVFGGSFKSGGGSFYFRCSNLPSHLNCVAEADKPIPESEDTVGTPTNSANVSEDMNRRRKFPELLP